MGWSILLLLLLTLAILPIYYLYRVQLIQSPQPINSILPDCTLYTNRLSYQIGDKIEVFAHSSTDFTINLYHLTTAKALINSNSHQALVQSKKYHPKYGYDWQNNVEINTAELKSGYYLIEITNGMGIYEHPIVITPKKPIHKIALFAATNTWLAYNIQGGQSNYLDRNNHIIFKIPYKLMNKAVPVYLPYRRPIYEDLKTGKGSVRDFENVNQSFSEAIKARKEWPLLAFLYEEGYEFDVYTDADLAYNPALLQYDTWIFNNHSEYWSDEMKGMLTAFQQKEGKIIFATGNNLYRDVEFYNGGIKMVNQVADKQTTTELTGTFFTEDGYLTMANYKIIAPNHLVFKGISSETFGEKSLFIYNGQSGASGIETDKINQHTNGFEIIAVGNNQSGPAHMVFKTNGKGFTFNASSISFSSSVLVDEGSKTIFRNLLALN